jgi:hypothetical protein
MPVGEQRSSSCFPGLREIQGTINSSESYATVNSSGRSKAATGSRTNIPFQLASGDLSMTLGVLGRIRPNNRLQPTGSAGG